MSKTIRESKMLDEVRRWRAEAYPEVVGQVSVQRQVSTKEWSRRLNLPLWDELADAGNPKSSVS